MSQMPDSSLPPGYASGPQKGWFGRNWWWVIPGGVMLPLCLCGAVCGSLGYFGLKQFENSDAYKLAFEAARQDPEVVEALGEPIRKSGLVIGSFNMNAGEGENASLQFSIQGPKGTAQVSSTAHKEFGAVEWSLERLVVTPSGRPPIVILEGGEPVMSGQEGDSPLEGETPDSSAPKSGDAGEENLGARESETESPDLETPADEAKSPE